MGIWHASCPVRIRAPSALVSRPGRIPPLCCWTGFVVWLDPIFAAGRPRLLNRCVIERRTIWCLWTFNAGPPPSSQLAMIPVVFGPRSLLARLCIAESG